MAVLLFICFAFCATKGKRPPRRRPPATRPSFFYILKVMPLLATPTMKNIRVNMA